MQVAWLFSMARSGSSVVAYAAAAPWSHPVADEILGPWDRTGPPYHYPPEQRELRDLYHADRCRLTPRVVDLTQRVCGMLDRGTGLVVSKHPHTRPAPDEFTRAFPTHRAVWLIRNPLHRLNSLYARGWVGAIRSGHDLEHFKEFARSWSACPHRVVYDALRDQPRQFFASVYAAWELDAGPRELKAAADYAKHHYHESSRVVSDSLKPRRVLSETKRALPVEAVQAYLGDPLIRTLMERVGWSTREADYLS